ncbi:MULTISPECIES: hypothetical protein [unclassified Sedimentibacter]|uniref:hypothetical protein n=1 Tax=unclassified Sedimentibacter TaxID=2649220 RepID=UPI0027E175D7|nr:hypothetical protein [Sedimentibacter sp. MB35-C1]WMJ77200.1 hypothetical protein RBQ61_16765 [Sedimentibacter sp. MB35-C1]
MTDEELIVVQAYNDGGRATAYNLLRSQYGIKNPYFVMKRIEKNPKFVYNNENDRYLLHDESQTDDVFMSMEKLCSPMASQHSNLP